MDKFSQIEKNDNKKVELSTDEKELYKGKYLDVIEYKDYEIVKESDMVVILPYLRDESCILLRHEWIPTYQYHYKDDKNYKDVTHFLTSISGQVDEGETLKNTVRRELYEETGIVLSNLYDFDIDNHLFLSKGNAAQYHICLLELRYNDFRVTPPKGDGTLGEELSQCIKVSLGDLDELRTHDLITDYMLNKFRLEYL